jgi:hypothetical protein
MFLLKTTSVKNVIVTFFTCPTKEEQCWRTDPWFMQDRDMRKDAWIVTGIWCIMPENIMLINNMKAVTGG